MTILMLDALSSHIISVSSFAELNSPSLQFRTSTYNRRFDETWYPNAGGKLPQKAQRF